MTSMTKPEARQDPRVILRAELTKYQGSLAKVLAKGITPESVVALTLVAATRSPALFDCTPESIAMALMRIGQWGLEIGTTAHLVPFGKECIAIPDWRGLIELARRGGVRDVTARVVYAKEHFRVEQGTEEFIEHHPIHKDGDRGEIVAFYAIARLPHNRSTFEVMTKAEVEAIQKAARSGNSPAWKNHFAEMGRKTVTKRLLKRLPQSKQLADALLGDEEEAVRVRATITPDAPDVPDAPAQLAAGAEVQTPAKEPEPPNADARQIAELKAFLTLPTVPKSSLAGINEAIALAEVGELDRETAAELLRELQSLTVRR